MSNTVKRRTVKAPFVYSFIKEPVLKERSEK